MARTRNARIGYRVRSVQAGFRKAAEAVPFSPNHWDEAYLIVKGLRIEAWKARDYNAWSILTHVQEYIRFERSADFYT